MQQVTVTKAAIHAAQLIASTDMIIKVLEEVSRRTKNIAEVLDAIDQSIPEVNDA